MINLMTAWKKAETYSYSYDTLCEYSSLAVKYPQVVFDFTVTIFMIVCSTTGMAHLKKCILSPRCFLGAVLHETDISHLKARINLNYI